jgi:GDP-L-fucose synthase
MQTILLTGSSGFVGKNFLSDKRSQKYNILNPSSTELNLLESNSVKRFIRQEKPDLIIHAAGRVGGILKNINSNFEFLTTNSLINLNLIMSIKEFKVKKFINLASSCIYPHNISDPISEQDLMKGPLEKTNEGYALAKLVGLKLTEYLSEKEGLMFKTIIPCNLYGPYDNFDIQTSHMIPGVIRKIHEAKTNQLKHVEIWGEGDVRREFMYVKDLINFLFYAIDNLEKIPSIINVGTGVDYTVYEYYTMISELISYEGNFKHDLSKPEGMKRKLVDTKEINKLGWKSKYSIQEGLKQTYKYFIENYG